MTYARVDFKAGKGQYKGYTIDRRIWKNVEDIANELMNKDVYKVEIYEGGTAEENIVFTKYNDR